MNIGFNPTVSQANTQTIETFFFDFDADLYGKHLKIELLKRIRDEKKFDSIEDLKTAMHKDMKASKQYISSL